MEPLQATHFFLFFLSFLALSASQVCVGAYSVASSFCFSPPVYIYRFFVLSLFCRVFSGASLRFTEELCLVVYQRQREKKEVLPSLENVQELKGESVPLYRYSYLAINEMHLLFLLYENAGHELRRQHALRSSDLKEMRVFNSLLLFILILTLPHRLRPATRHVLLSKGVQGSCKAYPFFY